MPEPNATVEYVDAESGKVLGVCVFYDPGLDPKSDYAKDWVKRYRKPYEPHMAFSCGSP